MYTTLPIISYVTFPSLDSVRPLAVSAQLRVPAKASGKLPAVVIAHGSAGVDSRGSFYAEALNTAGIATLEIDLWAARGWSGGITGRPAGVPETLPDAYGALKFLAERPNIDSQRIGILGFSWGGVIAMLTATRSYTARFDPGGFKFAAHVANYPVCWIYNRVPEYAFGDLTGAPVLIQTGELDSYDKPGLGEALVRSLPAAAQQLVSHTVYPGATHGWDRLEPAITVTDPFSHLGQGGQVDFVPNAELAARSRSAATEFFQKHLGLR